MGLPKLTRERRHSLVFLLNSTWKLWKLICNNRLQVAIIQPNSLLSTTSEFTWSTTLLKSKTKSTLSNWISDTLNLIYSSFRG